MEIKMSTDITLWNCCSWSTWNGMERGSNPSLAVDTHHLKKLMIPTSIQIMWLALQTDQSSLIMSTYLVLYSHWKWYILIILGDESQLTLPDVTHLSGSHPKELCETLCLSVPNSWIICTRLESSGVGQHYILLCSSSFQAQKILGGK